MKALSPWIFVTITPVVDTIGIKISSAVLPTVLVGTEFEDLFNKALAELQRSHEGNLASLGTLQAQADAIAKEKMEQMQKETVPMDVNEAEAHSAEQVWGDMCDDDIDTISNQLITGLSAASTKSSHAERRKVLEEALNASGLRASKKRAVPDKSGGNGAAVGSETASS